MSEYIVVYHESDMGTPVSMERDDVYSNFFSRDKCHDFIGIFAGTPKNLDNSVEGFESMTLEELDTCIAEKTGDITKAFSAHYSVLRSDFYEFRELLVGLSQKYSRN